MVTVQTWTTVRGIIWKQFQKVVADAAVRNVVTQRSSVEALRDHTENGCVNFVPRVLFSLPAGNEVAAA